MLKLRFVKSILCTMALFAVFAFATELLPISYDYFIGISYLLTVIAISFVGGAIYFFSPYSQIKG